MRCVIILFITSLCLGTSHERAIDDTDIIAFFNGDCRHEEICTELCFPWRHGYICGCHDGRVLKANGYSCSDALPMSTTTTTTTKADHKTTKETPTTKEPANVAVTTDKSTTSSTNESMQQDEYRIPEYSFNSNASQTHTDTISYKEVNSQILQPIENTNAIKIHSYDLKDGAVDPLKLSHSYTKDNKYKSDSLNKNKTAELLTSLEPKGNVINLDVFNLPELGAKEPLNIVDKSSQICGINECKNGAICRVVDNEPVCDCLLGYKGVRCQQAVEVRYPRFHGDGYIAFPVLRKAYRNFDIQLEIRPDSPDGLLLFTAEHPDARTDYFSLALINSQVQFRFDCGTGGVTILSEGNVSMGAWNTIAISRRETAGSLKLNTEPAQYGHSQGVYTRITLRENLYLGGHPNVSTLAARVGTNASFIGCIQHLWVGGYKYDMRPAGVVGDALHGINVDECSGDVCQDVICQNGGVCKAKSADSHVCMCVLGTDGHYCENSGEIHVPAFNGHSYLQYVGLHRSTLVYTEIDITFKPLHPDGLIMYNGYTLDRKGDFFSLAMRDGHVEFMFDLGTGHAVLRSTEQITMNNWHQARVVRTERLAYLYVDSQPPVDGLSNGPFTQLTLLLDLFIGGHKNFDQTSKHVNMTQSFTGCIQKVVINSQPVGLITEALDGVNVGNCDHKCSGIPCLNGGVCVPQHSNYACSCPLGFINDHCDTAVSTPFQNPSFSQTSYLQYTSHEIMKRIRGDSIDIQMMIKVKKPVGLLFWIGQQKMTPSNDFFALGFNDGLLEFRYNLGNGEAKMTSELALSIGSEQFNGTGWYYIRAQRYKQTGYLQVNERVIIEASSPGDYTNLDTDTPLYIGGMPDVARNTLNKYSTGFSGCIQTLTLSTNYKLDLMDMADGGQNVRQCS